MKLSSSLAGTAVTIRPGRARSFRLASGRQTETDGPAFGNGIGYGFRFVDEGSPS